MSQETAEPYPPATGDPDLDSSSNGISLADYPDFTFKFEAMRLAFSEFNSDRGKQFILIAFLLFMDLNWEMIVGKVELTFKQMV